MASAKRLAKLQKKLLRSAPDWKTMIATLGPIPNFKSGMSIAELGDIAKARVLWQRQLRELVETRRRSARISDPELLQESHSPTVEIAVDDPEATRKVRRNITRVRQAEAWRHNRLSGMQRDAEREMEFAWRQRTAGLGAASSRYGESRGASNRADLGSSVDASWCEWAKLTIGRRIMIAPVIDCLSEPKTLAQVERDHRMRRGQAFDNYVLALDLWCEVRGWIRGPRMDRGPTLAAEGVAR
jgi:hypothetical protein